MTARSCDGCTMCCTIMAITELEKPRNQHCQNCTVGKGCKIYDERPPSCRAFRCLYLDDLNMGEHWKPSRSHMLVTHYLPGRICVHVDPSRPDAWKKEPYHSDLKRLAALVTPDRIVAVYVRECVTVVLPDADVALGVVTEDREIRLSRRGPVYDVALK